MSVYGPFTNAEVYASAFRLSGVSNQASVEITRVIRERQCFGDLGVVRGYGPEDAEFRVAGFENSPTNMLHDGAFTDEPGHLQWAATEGFSIAANKALYAYDADASLLTQTKANMDVQPVNSTMYSFTYTVGTVTNTGVLAATITTSFALAAIALSLTAGTHEVTFKSAAAVGNFVISVTGGAAGDTFTLDGLHLRPSAGYPVWMVSTAFEYDSQVPMTLMIPDVQGTAVAAGDSAYFMQAIRPQYVVGGKWGEDVMFNFTAKNDGDGCQVGWVLNPGLVPVTATDTPAAAIVELQAVPAGQYLYAILHVFEATPGNSIVVKVQCDTLVGFASPTTVVTFTSAGGISAQYAVRVPGPITDTFWRAYPEITGASASIKFACAMAIGK